MNHVGEQEAASWVAAEVERLRGLDYDALLAIIDREEHRQMETAHGETLVLEIHVFWDDHRARQNLRVIVDVWNPSKRIWKLIAKDDFIRAPDSSFVGE